MVSTVNFRSSRSLLSETKAKPSTSAKTFPSTCLNHLGAGTWWVSVEMLHPTAPILSPRANSELLGPSGSYVLILESAPDFYFIFFPLLETIMEKKLEATQSRASVVTISCTRCFGSPAGGTHHP